MILETERLHLRPFSAADAEPYAARIYADANVMRYLPKRDTLPRERAQRNIEYFLEHWRTHSYGPWAVTEKASGEFIGHCGLHFLTDVNETEVLYAFAKKVWGKGYATEAARASVVFGFRQIGIERIIALAVPENIASRRVMEHCGLQYEKEAHLFDLDVMYYALNRADWILSANNTNQPNSDFADEPQRSIRNDKFV